jgi:hypothetical protein
VKGGEVLRALVTVKNGGVAVIGLVAADFVVDCYHGTATPVVAFTVSEIGNGKYRVNVTTPATNLPQWCTIDITSAAGYQVLRGKYAGMLRAHTIDEVYAQTVRPIVAGGAQDFSLIRRTLEVIAYRFTPVAFSRVDQSGDAIDLSISAYSNWRFSVWTKTHTGQAIYLLNSGITGDVDGNIAFNIPEDASFFAAIAAPIAAGEDRVQLFWDLIADKAGVSGQTQTILFGDLQLLRFEGAA